MSEVKPMSYGWYLNLRSLFLQGLRPIEKLYNDYLIKHLITREEYIMIIDEAYDIQFKTEEDLRGYVASEFLTAEEFEQITGITY
jgi:hypothetical protein